MEVMLEMKEKSLCYKEEAFYKDQIEFEVSYVSYITEAEDYVMLSRSNFETYIMGAVKNLTFLETMLLPVEHSL